MIKTETVAEITYTNEIVKVYFPEKRNDFREIIKLRLGYYWNYPYWERKIGKFSGTIEDRIIEAGYMLLATGFSIRIFDEILRNKAIKGEYTPERKKWIIQSKDREGKFCIFWSRDSGDFYTCVKKLPGARWSKPYVTVPVEQFEEVLGFAEVHGFELSEGAQVMVKDARKIKEMILTVNIEPKKEQYILDTGKPSILDVPENTEIDNEFKE